MVTSARKRGLPEIELNRAAAGAINNGTPLIEPECLPRYISNIERELITINGRLNDLFVELFASESMKISCLSICIGTYRFYT